MIDRCLIEANHAPAPMARHRQRRLAVMHILPQLSFEPRVFASLAHGFPVLFQNAATKSLAETTLGCSPVIFASSVAWRALNRFLNSFFRRISVGLRKAPRRRASHDTPSRSNAFLNRRSANPTGSLSARTIRTPMRMRLIRLTRCQWSRVL